MTPTDDLRQLLRKMLNETIPKGGTEADTSFSDKEIDDLLVQSIEVNAAASLGWTMKAGLLSERIEKYSVGEETYDKTTLKDMAGHALTMARHYAQLSKESPARKTTGFILKVTPPEIL